MSKRIAQRIERGKQLRIFISESASWRGKPLYQAILDLARQHEVICVVVMRGIEGFGPEHRLTTERLPDIADNLPLIIDIVEAEQGIELLLPALDLLVQRGWILVTPVEIVYAHRHA